MTNPFIGIPVVVLSIMLFVGAVLAAIRFLFYLANEAAYAKQVCPIWTNTLNMLLDSDSHIVDYGGNFTIAGTRVNKAEYNRELGERCDTDQRVDRATQRRLHEHLAKKDAIAILQRAEREGTE